MDSFEWNKVFAAVLVAGIVASFSGFLASQFVSPEEVTAHGPEAEGTAGPSSAEPAGPEPILALLAAADPARGQKLFRACASCHSVESGGPDGVGPNLWNVLTRGVATADGYSYSGALVEAAGDSWEYAELNEFIWKPKAYAPGTKMNYIGLKKPEDRAAIVAYLRTLSDNPPAMPSESEIAAETAASQPAEVDGEGIEVEIVEEPEDLETMVPPATHQDDTAPAKEAQ